MFFSDAFQDTLNSCQQDIERPKYKNISVGVLFT